MTRAINNTTTNPSLGAARAGGASSLAEAKKAKAGASIDASPPDLGNQPGSFDVNLSPAARDKAQAFQKALDIARATPDVREDRVAELKQKIKDGNYRVDSGKIADGMLMEAIKDKLTE